MPNRTHVIFVNHEGSRGSVFHSQYLQTARQIRDSEQFEVRCVVYEPLFYFIKGQWKKLRDSLVQERLQPAFYPRLPFIASLVNALYSWPLLKMINDFPVDQVTILHCRGPHSTLIAVWSKLVLGRRRPNLRIIFDCRGEGAAEIEFYSSKPAWFKWFRIKQYHRLMRFILRHCDHVLVVSRPLENFLRESYGYTGSLDITPSSVDLDKFATTDEQRNHTRQSLGLADRFVVVYSGSMLPWQMPAAMVEIFSLFLEAEPRSFFLILSKDAETAIRILQAAHLPANSYKVMACQYDLLASHISCGDVALLVREKNMVNRVASPTKFVEYLACGVPVVMTRYIGDVEDVLAATPCGWFAESLADKSEVRSVVNRALAAVRNGDIDRHALKQTAQRFFSMQAHRERLLQAYRKLS